MPLSSLIRGFGRWSLAVCIQRNKGGLRVLPHEMVIPRGRGLVVFSWQRVPRLRAGSVFLSFLHAVRSVSPKPPEYFSGPFGVFLRGLRRISPKWEKNLGRKQNRIIKGFAAVAKGVLLGLLLIRKPYYPDACHALLA